MDSMVNFAITSDQLGMCRIVCTNIIHGGIDLLAESNLSRNPWRAIRKQNRKRAAEQRPTNDPRAADLFVPEPEAGVRGSLVCPVEIFRIFLLRINPTRNTRPPTCPPLKILLTNNPLGCIRNPRFAKGRAAFVFVRFSRVCTRGHATVCERRKRGEIRRNGQR